MRQIAAKRDKAEPRLVEYLTRVGATVTRISSGGLPDLLVGFLGVNLLLEVKSEIGTLTDPQLKFFDTHLGQAAIVRTIKDVKRELKTIVPTYIYECDKCGEVLETKQDYADQPINTCPKCDGKLVRVIQKVTVIYNADGFTKKTKRES